MAAALLSIWDDTSNRRMIAASLLWGTALAVILICFTAFLYQQHFVRILRFSDVTYRLDNGTYTAGTMPLYVLTEGEHMLTVNFIMHLPHNYPRSFRIIPDDCLESITINGVMSESEQLPLCPPAAAGHVYDLADQLQEGANTVSITVKDSGVLAALKIIPEQRAAYYAAKIALYLLAISIALFLPWRESLLGKK